MPQRLFLLNRRFIILISLFILLISIPLILLLTQKSQDIRQRASGTDRTVLLDSRIGITHARGQYPVKNNDFLVYGAQDAYNLGFQTLEVYISTQDICTKDNTKYPLGFYQTLEGCPFTNLTTVLQTQRYRELFSLNIGTFFLTADGATNTAHSYLINSANLFSTAQKDALYQEFFRATEHLLQTYKNTNKTFIFQTPNEMDWNMLTAPNENLEPTNTAIQNAISYWNTIQKAIDDAKQANSSTGVNIFHACEVNLVVKGMDNPNKKTATNSVLPQTHCDLYGYSSYDTIYLPDTTKFLQTFIYLKEKAPNSNSFGNNNVYVSEMGVPENEMDTQRAQDITRITTQQALAQNAPYVLYWQIYDNECSVFNPQPNQCRGLGLRKPQTLALSPIYANVLLANYSIPFPSATSSPSPIKITTIDSNGSFYGTYQSHNQKIVSNQNGIFITYVHETINKDQPTEKDTWRLARSTNNGQTFTIIYEATSGTRAPVIETDSENNIYLIEADWSSIDQHSNFYMFSENNNYQNPVKQTTINLHTISAKYTMEIDEARSQIYYFTLGNTFTILNLDGTIKKQFQLTKNGPNGTMHYPYLYLDENGYLYVAWTTTLLDGSHYHSIHFIRSKDGGNTWEKPNGQALSLPITADENGPTDTINAAAGSADTWLQTMIVKAGKAHFMYYAKEPFKMHYLRYDLTTGQKDNIHPFKGETITLSGWDGFCATDRLPNMRIYCINRNSDPYALAALKSDDNGNTWQDYAITPAFQHEVYALGGSPFLINGGSIIGAFTESSNFQDSQVPKIIKFFNIIPPSITPTDVLTPTATTTQFRGDANKDGKVDFEDLRIWEKEFKGISNGKQADFNNDSTVTIEDFSIWKRSKD